MEHFESSLLLYSNLKETKTKDFKLVNTKKIKVLENMFCIYQSKYLYTIDKNTLDIYRLIPYTQEYTKQILFSKCLDMIFIKEDLFCVMNNRLIKNMDKSINIPNVTNIKLLNINNNIGIQYDNILLVYNTMLIKISEYKCSISYYFSDILVISYHNVLSIYIKDIKKVDIHIEDSITSLVFDTILSNIYCGTITGKIYIVSLDNTPNKVIGYHKTEIKHLKLSFCNRFLYSADSTGELLVIDCKYLSVIDRIVVEGLIKMDVYITGTCGVENIPIRDL